ncbi:hypothetical protein [Pantoea dispersa]|uniref:hypothetical protein n=1 Tax=Pantoea dispersa TaxID=59814 RepID=UPI001BAA798C|nr:hypothetical protein [Pantoea dispersa]MBS0900027.1 hypothetical protein [Pantoea dispersa]
MLTLTPVWHGRLRAARGMTNLLMQTLVIHPALLFFLLFLLSAHHAGGAGQMLLDEAEKLVRDAPPGQVWGCVSQASSMKAFPPATPDELQNGTPVPDAVKLSVAPPVLCEKTAVSREAWAVQTSGTLLLLYKAGVMFSVISGLAIWYFRRRAKGENA